MDLKPWEIVFANKYIQCNNKTQAYLAARPGVKTTTAGTEGYNTLKRPEIREYIRRQMDKVTDPNLHSKANILQDAYILQGLATSKLMYNTAIKAVQLRAQIQGLFAQQTADTSQFDKIIALNTVNVQVNNYTSDQLTQANDLEPLGVVFVEGGDHDKQSPMNVESIDTSPAREDHDIQLHQPVDNNATTVAIDATTPTGDNDHDIQLPQHVESLDTGNHDKQYPKDIESLDAENR